MSGDRGQVMRLAVHPELRGRGIGRSLLNHCLAYCQSSHARSVIINTQESNHASLALYESVGFRRIGARVPLVVRSLAAKTDRQEDRQESQ